VHSHESNPDYRFDLSGGILCLDFANTMSRRKVAERSIDHLGSYNDLVAFAEQAGTISPQQAGDLRVQAQRHGSDAQGRLRRAVSFRENLYRTFSALAKGKPAASDDVQRINDLAIEALNHRRLVRSDGHYRWEWQWNNTRPLDSILWPIAQSAADLLTSPQLATVRVCEAPDCAWLFLDQSRNSSRRWCDMKVCGNREKARRYYQRTHS
jgi:predicted RNA-binding Zn ribbon-like protein